ncbi:hypothetical protein Ga0100230_010485 [Opitutaceae bacterium TAV3]|nr:hypothetical protein Ga0100230_010485 [Opitutaceae bacterium TAV3]
MVRQSGGIRAAALFLDCPTGGGGGMFCIKMAIASGQETVDSETGSSLQLSSKTFPPNTVARRYNHSSRRNSRNSSKILLLILVLVLTPAWFIWRFYNPPLPSSPELAEETPLGGQDAVSVIPTALIPDAQEPAPAAPPPDQVAETTPITVTPLEPVAQDTTLPSSSGIQFSETTAPDSASVAVTSATGAVALTDVPPPTGVATFDVPPTIEFPAPGSTVTVQEAPPAASTAGVVSHPSILLPPVIAFPPRASASSSHSAPVSDPAPAVPPPPPPPPPPQAPIQVSAEPVTVVAAPAPAPVVVEPPPAIVSVPASEPAPAPAIASEPPAATESSTVVAAAAAAQPAVALPAQGFFIVRSKIAQSSGHYLLCSYFEDDHEQIFRVSPTVYETVAVGLYYNVRNIKGWQPVKRIE